MRKNYLPFGLITAFFGITMFFLSALSLSGQTGSPDIAEIDRLRWESIRANQLTGVVDPLDLVKAREQADAMRIKSLGGAMGLNWASAGPDNYPGLVSSAIFDKTDANSLTIVAGSAAGGIWKSTNLGLTWSQMAVENNSVLKVTSLVQAANGTIYASTGLMSCKSITNNGSGIYKSENGGAFTVLSATKTNPDFAGVSKLALDPVTGRLFAATYGGLWYSDNGNEWSEAKSGYAMDVCVGSDGTVLTSVGDSGYLAVGGNLSSWVTLTTGKPNFLPKSGIGWMVFAIAPSDANVMYASLAGIDGRLLGVYCSTDKGSTWSVVFPSNPTFEPFGTAVGCYANTMSVFPNDPDKLYLGGTNIWYGRRVQPTGFYNWEVLSSGLYSPWIPNSAPAYHHAYMFRPNDPNQIVMATDGGVCIGTNSVNGLEFQTSNKYLGTSQFYSVAHTSDKNFVMGGGRNIGSLAMGYFYPTFTNSLTDGFPLYQPTGLFLGTNGGSCAWSNLNYHVGVFTVRGATSTIQRQDFRDLAYANDFMMGIASAYTDFSPMQLWESFNFTQTQDSVEIFARAKPIPADTLIQVESKNGITFPYYTTQPLAQGDSMVVADPIASRFFYYGNKATTNYGYGIYMTKDMLKFYKDPEYFIVLKDTANKVDMISAFAVSSDLNTLWAGTKKGRLIRVTGLVNAQDSLTANEFTAECVLVKDVFANTPVLGRYVTSISINPNNTNEMMVTLGNSGNQDYVFYCTNASSADPVFTSIQSNLPKVAVFSGLLELHGNNAIVGTDVGVYSTNSLSNPTWAADMANMGDVIVTDIRQQTMRDYHVNNYGVIYLASFGRGIWMDTTYYSPVAIEPVIGASTYSAMVLNPNPVKDNVNITFTTQVAGTVEVSVYDLTGRVVLSQSFGQQAKGTFNGKLNVANLPAGSYIVKSGNSSGKLIKY